jgi:hypothetical protein
VSVTRFFHRLGIAQRLAPSPSKSRTNLLAGKMLNQLVGGIVRIGGTHFFTPLFLVSLVCQPSQAEDGAALFGVAAIAGAASGMVTSAAGISAQKYQNRLSAEVAKYNTDKLTGLSEYQAGLNSYVSLSMARMQLAATYAGQYSATQNLQMLLSAQDRARTANAQANSEQLRAQYSLLNRGMDLQEKMVNQQFALSLAPYQSTATGGGLYSLFSSGSAMGVRQYGLARQLGQPTSDRLLSGLSSTAGLGVRSAPANANLSRALVSASRRGFSFASAGVDNAVSRSRGRGVRSVGIPHVASDGAGSALVSGHSH